MVIKRCLFLVFGTQPERLANGQTAFEYVSHLKTIGAATAPSSFLQAINFMIYTVEPAGAQAIVESYRILGVVKQASSQKRALKQAPALRVDMVLQLHAILRHQAFNALGVCRTSKQGQVHYVLPAFGKATASRTSWLARRGNVKMQHLARATQSGYKVDLVGLADVLVWQSKLRLGNLARVRSRSRLQSVQRRGLVRRRSR